uniref:NUMOD1 domain protein n=1 Tax=Pithovirus LCPAC406 TaxID=2506599 RepID=A0A481ZCV2_9VIRU|nr:MAG: NUMOD1 domain protein [Pithovirus LCPAC406]
MVISVPVKQFAIDGQFIKYYTSMSEAYKNTGVRVTSIVGACIGNIIYSTGGFRWSYADKNRIMKVTVRQKCTPVNQLDIHGNTIRTFSSIIEAATELSIGRRVISDVCKGKRKSVKGCYFKYVYAEDIDRKHVTPKQLNQLSLKGEFINRFNSVTEAAKILSIKKGNISRSCRLLCPCSGFRFEYR